MGGGGKGGLVVSERETRRGDCEDERRQETLMAGSPCGIRSLTKMPDLDVVRSSANGARALHVPRPKAQGAPRGVVSALRQPANPPPTLSLAQPQAQAHLPTPFPPHSLLLLAFHSFLSPPSSSSPSPNQDLRRFTFRVGAIQASRL